MKDKVLKVITSYYKETNFMPSIREVQKIIHSNNHNCVYKIFKQLENDGVLIHDKNKRKKNFLFYLNIDKDLTVVLGGILVRYESILRNL